MKKFSFIVCLISTISFFSCSSDDSDEINPQEKATYKIEISREGDTENFSEILTVVLLTDDGQEVDLSGAEWDGEPVRVKSNTLNFSKTGGEPKNVVLEPSEEVQAVLVMNMIEPKNDSAEEMVSYITIYRNGEKIEEFEKVIGSKGDHYTIETSSRPINGGSIEHENEWVYTQKYGFDYFSSMIKA